MKNNVFTPVKALSILSTLVSFLLIAISITGIVFLLCSCGESESTQSSSDTVQTEAIQTTSAQPETTETVTEPTEEETTADPYDVMISEMSLHDKICQMMIVVPEALSPSDPVTNADGELKTSIESYPVCGLILFAKNLISSEQTSQLISDCRNFAAEAGAPPLMVGVDEEGGVVARCAGSLGTTAFSPMYTYRELGEETAYSNAFTIASDISAIGFDTDFAPCADTWSNRSNTVIGTRAYSDDFNETAVLVSAAVRGFRDGGVYCSLKHFPGHGDTSEDTHYGNAYSDKTIEQLRSEEYLSFAGGIAAGADIVMVGHMIMSSVDGLPASLSPVMITDELRGYLGFNGVVITDSMSMGAVTNTYTSGESAVLAVKAGVDILLMPQSLSETVAALENAVETGEISEERINESVKRILILKNSR